MTTSPNFAKVDRAFAMHKGEAYVQSLTKFSRLALLALSATLLMAARAPLTGEWGGERVKLTLSATGGSMEFDCSYFELTRPIAPGKSGKFTAPALLEVAIGPMRLNQPKGRPAVFSGRIRGDLLQLDVRVEGEPTPRHYQLHRGQKVELYACM